MTLKVSGIKETVRNLAAVQDKAAQVIKQAVAAEVAEVKVDSRSAVPVDSGRLRRSQRSRVEASGDEVRGAVGFGKRARYAAPVESRKRFLARAIDEGRFRRRLESELRRLFQ